MSLKRLFIWFGLVNVGVIAFLSFAPPQSCRYCYLWQLHMLKAPERKTLKADNAEGYRLPDIVMGYPESFDGIWTDWSGDGRPMALVGLRRGVPERSFLIEYLGDGDIELVWMKVGDEDFGSGKELVYSVYTGFDRRPEFPEFFSGG